MQRRLQNVEHSFRKMVEGLVDINKILDQQHQQLLKEQASSSFSEGEQSSSIFVSSTEEESKLHDIFEEGVPLTSEVLEQLQTDETVHSVIGKIFGLQRYFESEISELKHKIKMQQMQIDEGESMKFDIEILNDEKAMLDSEL